MKKIIISFNGQEGSGKSTIAKMIAKELELPHYYMGQIFRDMAAEMGLTLPQFRKVCEQDSSFDNKVDDHIIQLAKEKDRFVIESRTAWHFIPDSIKIYLKVDSRAAAERIQKALGEKNNRANEDSSLNTVDEIQKSILTRRKEDSERYFLIYGITQDNDEDYDFIIDTTNLSINEVYSKVSNFIKSKINE